MRHIASEQPERKLGMHPRSLSAGTAWLLHEDAATQAEARLSRQLLFGGMNISRPRAAPRVLYGRRIAGVCCDERWHGATPLVRKAAEGGRGVGVKNCVHNLQEVGLHGLISAKQYWGRGWAVESYASST